MTDGKEDRYSGRTAHFPPRIVSAPQKLPSEGTVSCTPAAGKEMLTVRIQG